MYSNVFFFLPIYINFAFRFITVVFNPVAMVDRIENVYINKKFSFIHTYGTFIGSRGGLIFVRGRRGSDGRLACTKRVRCLKFYVGIKKKRRISILTFT